MTLQTSATAEIEKLLRIRFFTNFDSGVKRNFWPLRNFWTVNVFQLFCFSK